MKALPKLMKNSVLDIHVVSEEMSEFNIHIVGSTSWPSVARLDKQTKTLRFLDGNGKMILEMPDLRLSGDLLTNFGLA